jgi:hypothetical protein
MLFSILLNQINLLLGQPWENSSVDLDLWGQLGWHFCVLRVPNLAGQGLHLSVFYLLSFCMKKHLKFTLILTGILLTRAYDAYCTALFTPDLKREGNLLASVFHLHWSGLLLSMGCVLLYVIYALYINTYKQINLFPAQRQLSFGQFVAQALYGPGASWKAFLYKFPADTQKLHYVFGYILSRGLLWAGVVTTIMWVLINHTATYYTHFHSYSGTMSLILGGVAVVAYYYFNQLYTAYKSLE